MRLNQRMRLLALLLGMGAGCEGLLGGAPSSGVQLDPTSLDFGNLPVGQTSAPKVVALSNSGATPLQVSAVAATGDYLASNGCVAAVGPRASCSIAVTFKPLASGARSGRLSITDSARGSPRTVALAGTGVTAAPVATVSPMGLDFGDQLVGQTSAARSVSLTNGGNGALSIATITADGDFSQANDCRSSLAPGSTCTIGVTVRPSAGGPRSGVLTIADDAPGSPRTVALTAVGVSTGPVANLSPSTLDFGGQLVGQTSSAKALTLSNTGNAVLALSGIATTGDFAESDGCGSSLPAGGSCSIQVTFTPQASGPRSGALTVHDNAPGSSRTAIVTGVGVETGPVVSVAPASLGFGNQPFGQPSAAKAVTLSNVGNAALAIGSISTSGDYGQTNGCGTSLPAGGHCTIQVTFTPQGSGGRDGTLSITDNAQGSPHTVALSGTGTMPVAGLSPTSLDFGSQPVGQTTAARTVALSNTGNAALAITGISASGDYAQTNGCGSSLSAGGNCSVQVTFTPQANGPRSGALTINDNAPGSPHTVSLSGTGTTASTGPSYPLRVSANGRYLVDQNGIPWRVQADAAWFMSALATPSQVDTYLSTRKGQGFNSLYLMAMVHPGGYGQVPNAPNNVNGDPPFVTPNDFSTAGGSAASQRYWAAIDTIISKAAAQGMVVMLAYTYLGYTGGPQGWADVVLSQPSRQACTAWGVWLGNRYKDRPNLIWFALGDYTPPPGSELEARTLAIANGIKSTGATQLFMAEPSGGDANPILDAPAFAALLDMNSFYGYGPSGRGDCYPQAARAYGVSPPKPAWMQEGGYEFENNTGGYTGQSYETRRSRFWSVLGGGTAGDGFGSRDVYTLQDFPASLQTPGATFSTLAFQLLASLPWWDLRPSGVGPGLAGKTLVTSGGGTFGQMDYVTAAVTGAGSHLLAYIPTVGGTGSRTLSIDMTAMAGPTRSRWWDPASGSYTSDATALPNTGSRSFTSPGANTGGQNDWVLVLDPSP